MERLSFRPPSSEDDYRFAYDVLAQRDRSRVVDAHFHLPSYAEHVANVQTQFASYHIIWFDNDMIGVVYFKIDYEMGLHFLTRAMVRLARQLAQLRIPHLGAYLAVEYIRLVRPRRWNAKAYNMNALALQMDKRVMTSDYVAAHYSVSTCEHDDYVWYELVWKG